MAVRIPSVVSRAAACLASKEDVLDEREVGPCAMVDRADITEGRLSGWHHLLVRASRRRSHDLVGWDADWTASFRTVVVIALVHAADPLANAHVAAGL